MHHRTNIEVIPESALAAHLFLFESIDCLSVVVCAFVRILRVGLLVFFVINPGFER